jgi:hypothetical protein
MGTTSCLDITCSALARSSKLSGSTCRCVWKNVSRHSSKISPHKRMSVDGCLEEMLLHTNEGVAPHTKTILRYIQELKKKHGIDYDSQRRM